MQITASETRDTTCIPIDRHAPLTALIVGAAISGGDWLMLARALVAKAKGTQ